MSARPDPRAVAGLYLVLCDGLVAGTYLDPGTDRQQGALDTANSTNGGVTSAVQIGNGGRVTARARHDHPLAERLARAAIEEGGGFQARYVAAEAAHFQGRPGQAEQELAALAADAVSDAERARVALLRFDNAFFLRGRTDLRLIDDVADAITVPVWRDELLTRRFFVVGVNSGPRAAVEAGSAMLQRAGSEPLTAAHVMLSYNLVRLGRLDDASQLLSPPPAAERYPRPISLGTSGRCS